MAFSEIRRKKLALSAVFFTFFIDALSWSIVFPIFAPFFLDADNHLFSSGVTMATRTTILGIFLSAFSFGQFFGAPLLGEYADRRGRKRALCISVFCTLVGIALTAWSIERQNLYLLFAGRLITGLFAGNMAICMACIADLHEEEVQKVKYFGRLSVISGLSFVLGAFLGGKLADPSISSWFSPSLPLWVATGLTAINLAFVLLWFPETTPVGSDGAFNLWQRFGNLKEALQTKQIKLIYAIFFLFLFAWTMLLQFTPVLFVENFDYTNSNIGDLALFMGVCWAIGSGYLNKVLVERFSTLKILEASLLSFTLLCALIVFQNRIFGVLVILAICVMIGGLSWPLCTGMISSAAPASMQGKILGLSQSMQSMAMALAPALGGLAYQLFSGFPFILGAASTLAAGILYFALKDR